MGNIQHPTSNAEPRSDGQGPSGICACGTRAYKKFHGRDWVCARCEQIEIEFNKRRRRQAAGGELKTNNDHAEEEN